MHFRSGIGGDSQITTTAYNIIADLDALEALIKGKAQNLEASLTQIEDYQKQIQELKKRVLQEEQQLRLIMAPTYLPGDRDKAASEQQVRDTLLPRFKTFIHLDCHFVCFIWLRAICKSFRLVSFEQFESVRLFLDLCHLVS